MSAVSKGNLINTIVSETGIKEKTVKKVVDTLFTEIEVELASGGEVSIRDFGKFEQTQFSATNRRNPRTGEPVKVPAHWQIKFRPCNALKQKVR